MKRFTLASLAASPLLSLPWLLAGSTAQEATIQEAASQDSASEAGASEDKVSQEELEAMTEVIKAEIEALREEQFPRPVKVGLANGEVFRAYVTERLERSTSAEELAAQEITAKLMGMIPADMDLLEAMMAFVEGQVGGFYDPSTESFHLMESFTGGLARVILAHELTHALDDQLYDLDGAMDARKGNTDRLSAYQGVVEGSGTAVMNAWTIDHMGELSAQDLAGADMGMDELGEAPPYIWRPLLAVYLRGAAFLVRSDSLMAGQSQRPQLADFERAFRHPPESSEQLLHPEKYWDEASLDPPRTVELKVRRPPQGWGLIHQDTLGEMSLASFIEPLSRRGGLEGQTAIFGARFTYGPSEGWGGDRLALLAKEGSPATYLELVTVWDDPAEAAEFELALEYLRTHLEESVAATAAQFAFEDHGVAWKRKKDEVTYQAWIGATDDEVKRLARAVRSKVGS